MRSKPISKTWLRHLRPLKLDFYILGEIIFPSLGGILFFTFVFLMFQAFRLAEFFIVHGIGAGIILKMVALLMLSFMPTALPIAFLVGILIGFGRLSADSEMVAMKANGISLRRMSVPVIALSFVVVALSLGLNLEWVPWGDRTFKKTLIRLSNTKVASSIKEGTFTTGFYDLLIFTDKIDPKTHRMKKVFIYDEREPKNPLTVVAREGEIVPVQRSGDLGTSIMLRLHDGNIHRNDLATSTYNKIDFGEYQLFLKIDEGADNATVKPRMIPYRELRKDIANAAPGSRGRREFEAELWRRYAVAVSPIIFVFLGIGFGTIRTRAVRAGAALIAFTVISLYWAVQATATVAAQKGYISPFLAMQLPNLALLALAIPAYRSANW